MLDSQKLSSLPTYLTYDDVLLLPNYSEVRPGDADLSAKLSDSIDLKVPVIASPMDTVCEERMATEIAKIGGIGIIHKNLTVEQEADQVKAVHDQGLLVGASASMAADFEARIEASVKAGADVICIDTSHGNTKKVIEATKATKQKYPQVTVMSGNVSTYEGAKALFEAGADVLRVGMGPGAICTTRVMSGMGVPQLTAIVEAVRAAKELKGKYVIADGGIRMSGDITKALAAGAHTIMAGSLLAGTDEAPGEVIEINGKMFKTYRGMGSVGAMKEGGAARYGQEYKEGETKKLVPEGVEGLVPHKGSLEDHLHQLMGGLRAGMAYLGAANLDELKEKARFIRISNASLIESKPHSIVMN